MDKHQRYNRSKKGRERYARYEASLKGVTNRLRQDAKKRQPVPDIIYDSQEETA